MKLTTRRIALGNLLYRRARTLSLLALVAAITFVISAGSLFGFSLLNGIQNTEDRLGADLMVVPLGADRDLEGALLQGKPSTFYIAGETATALLSLTAPERTSAQIFLATFDSDHCAFPVQIIGYDPLTDFVVAPWLEQSIPGGPQDGEIVIGSEISLALGEEMLIFGSRYRACAQLAKSGMGFDTSVFVNMETARELVQKYETFLGAIPLPDDHDAVSAVTIALPKGVDAAEFAKSLREEFRGHSISVVLPQTIIGNLAQNLDLTLVILSALLTAIWLLSVVVLAIVFTVMLGERRQEFGVFRAIGATRQKLVSVLMTESFLVGAAGAALGLGLMCLLVFPFSNSLAVVLSAKFLLPNTGETILILFAAFALCAATGPLASVYAAYKLGRSDAFTMIREGA